MRGEVTLFVGFWDGSGDLGMPRWVMVRHMLSLNLEMWFKLLGGRIF